LKKNEGSPLRGGIKNKYDDFSKINRGSGDPKIKIL